MPTASVSARAASPTPDQLTSAGLIFSYIGSLSLRAFATISRPIFAGQLPRALPSHVSRYDGAANQMHDRRLVSRNQQNYARHFLSADHVLMQVSRQAPAIS